MAKAKRAAILDAAYGLVSSIPGVVWKLKSDKPLLRVGQENCPAFYIFDFQEQITATAKPSTEIVQAKVFLIMEFWAIHALNQKPSEILNDILVRVQQALGASKLDGLAQEVEEVGSKFKVESAEARLVSCEVVFAVTYMRKVKDGWA